MRAAQNKLFQNVARQLFQNKLFQNATKMPKTDKQTNSWLTIFCEKEHFPKEKKQVLVRFESRIFAVPGIFGISRLNWRERIKV